MRTPIVSFGLGLLVMIPVALWANWRERRSRERHWVMGAPCDDLQCWCRR